MSNEQTKQPVLIAVASKGDGLIDEHFGHAREFLIYEVSAAGARLLGSRRAELYCSGPDECNNAESTLAKTIRALQGCQILLCAKIGYGPWNKLEAAGIQPNSEHAFEPIEAALLAVYRELRVEGKLDAVSLDSGQASA